MGVQDLPSRARLTGTTDFQFLSDLPFFFFFLSSHFEKMVRRMDSTHLNCHSHKCTREILTYMLVCYIETSVYLH